MLGEAACRRANNISLGKSARDLEEVGHALPDVEVVQTGAVSGGASFAIDQRLGRVPGVALQVHPVEREAQCEGAVH